MAKNTQNGKEQKVMKLKITCIPGDGIGPEIVDQAKRVLDKIGSVYNHEIEYTDILMDVQ